MWCYFVNRVDTATIPVSGRWSNGVGSSTSPSSYSSGTWSTESSSSSSSITSSLRSSACHHRKITSTKREISSSDPLAMCWLNNTCLGYCNLILILNASGQSVNHWVDSEPAAGIMTRQNRHGCLSHGQMGLWKSVAFTSVQISVLFSYFIWLDLFWTIRILQKEPSVFYYVFYDTSFVTKHIIIDTMEGALIPFSLGEGALLPFNLGACIKLAQNCFGKFAHKKC